MIYRIFFAAFLAILNFSSMNGSAFGVSPNQGFVQVMQEFYEFDVDSKHIITGKM